MKDAQDVEVENAFHVKNRAMKLAWDEHTAAAQAADAAGDTATADAERAAATRIKQDFIMFNIGQAGAMVRKWSVRSDTANMEDYKHSAVEGMLKAFDKWDPNKGTWATYSQLHIKGESHRAVNKAAFAHLSYGDLCQRPMVIAEEARQRAILGRTPTDQEIADGGGLSVGVVKRVRQPAPTSLDAPVGDGENSLVDLMSSVDDDIPDFDIGGVVTLSEEQEDFVRSELAGMPAFQCAVVVRLFGLDGAPPQTLSEIGETLGTSREAARRAGGKAIENLRFALG